MFVDVHLVHLQWLQSSYLTQESLSITLLCSVCLLVICLSFAGEVLGHLCHQYGPEVYRELEPMLMNGISGNLERDQDCITEHVQLMEKLSGRRSLDKVEDKRVICCHKLTYIMTCYSGCPSGIHTAKVSQRC